MRPDRPRPHLALYETTWCAYCARVNRALSRLNLEIERRNLRDPAHRAALHAATGRTQVPCLFIDGVPLFESADIIAWLEAHARTRGERSP